MNVASVKFRADLRCYFCGFTSMRIEGEKGRPLSEARLVQASTGAESSMPSRLSLHCIRCRGPLFMDQPEVIYAYKLAIGLDPPPRRGRSPRAVVAPVSNGAIRPFVGG